MGEYRIVGALSLRNPRIHVRLDVDRSVDPEGRQRRESRPIDDERRVWDIGSGEDRKRVRAIPFTYGCVFECFN